jgi:hypothetical protein
MKIINPIEKIEEMKEKAEKKVEEIKDKVDEKIEEMNDCYVNEIKNDFINSFISFIRFDFKSSH